MELTSKERILLAVKNQIPDRVPVMPDMSNMIPCKFTGKPYWEIYLNNNPDLYYAYAKVADYYGIDGWYQCFTGVKFKRKTPNITYSADITSKTNERITQRIKLGTSKGDLFEEVIYFSDNPPTKTEKMVKDILLDYPKLKEAYYGDIIGYDTPGLEDYRRACGDKGIFCLVVAYPGIQYWHELFEGNAASAIYACYDYPEVMDEWAYLYERDCIKQAEILLDQKPDVLLLGGSGTLTLSTPELVRKYSLPAIKKMTKMAKEADIPTMLHSCGKSMVFLEMLANETDLDCINPLEEPPMGDCYLKEVKEKYGHKLSLMGNLNTTNIMLDGTVEDVEKAAKKAIDDAGNNGGFILSTGDQCGRDTPDANIFKLVEVARTYGKY